MPFHKPNFTIITHAYNVIVSGYSISSFTYKSEKKGGGELRAEIHLSPPSKHRHHCAEFCATDTFQSTFCKEHLYGISWKPDDRFGHW